MGELTQLILAASSSGAQSAITSHQCQATLRVTLGLSLSLGFQKFPAYFQRPRGFFLGAFMPAPFLLYQVESMPICRSHIAVPAPSSNQSPASLVPLEFSDVNTEDAQDLR